ncbi:MAG TPA: hypothetical protein VGL10_09905 [Gammaproteobacteria bacterium]
MSIFILLSIAACEKQPEPETDQEITANDVKRETGEAVDSATQYSAAKKDEFIRDMEANLQTLGRDIQTLENRARKLNGVAQEKLHSQIAELKQGYRSLETDISKLQAATGNAYENMKAGVQMSWQNLKQAYGRTAEQFSG